MMRARSRRPIAGFLSQNEGLKQHVGNAKLGLANGNDLPTEEELWGPFQGNCGQLFLSAY